MAGAKLGLSSTRVNPTALLAAGWASLAFRGEGQVRVSQLGTQLWLGLNDPANVS